MRTTIQPAISSAANAVPRRRGISRTRQSIWLGAAATACGGVLLGAAVSGNLTATAAALGLLLATGIAVYHPALGLAVLAVTASLELTITWPVKSAGSIVVVAILLLAWTIRQGVAEGWRWRSSRLDAAVILFIAATALSLLGAGGNLEEPLHGLLLAATAALLFFLATQSLRTRTDVFVVLGGVLAAALLQAARIAVAVVTGSQPISEQTRAAGALTDPNQFAGLLVLCIPLVVALGVAFSRRWMVGPTAVVALVMAIALLASLSRSGWLGLLSSVIVLALLLPERRWRLASIVAAVVLLFVVAGFTTPISARLAPHAIGPWEMLASRWAVWTAALSLLIHHPLFGVGVSNFHSSVSPLPVFHAHNLFLNIAAERGLIGLAAFLLVLVRLGQVLRSARRIARSAHERALVAGLVAVVVAFLVHSLFEVSYYDAGVLLLFWLLLGLSASLPRVLTPGVESVAP